MMMMTTLLEKIETEMALAAKARRQGREGRARVCARRAAGWAVAVYRRGKFGLQPHNNAYHLLRWFQGIEDVPIELRLAAARLTRRVTPEHTLPHSQDPLRDAGMLIEALLREEDGVGDE